MSQENYLMNLTAGARTAYLQQNAAKIDQGRYVKPMTEDEISAGKDTLTENCIKLADLDAELDTIKETFKNKIKPLRLANEIILQEIRVKQRIADGCVYHIPDHDAGVMESYNEDGEFLESRRLRPDEKQGGLFKIAYAQ